MPIVTLIMGPTLNPDDIKEGDGVYFECNVKSNPKPYKMAWFHDVSILCGVNLLSNFAPNFFFCYFVMTKVL